MDANPRRCSPRSGRERPPRSADDASGAGKCRAWRRPTRAAGRGFPERLAGTRTAPLRVNSDPTKSTSPVGGRGHEWSRSKRAPNFCVRQISTCGVRKAPSTPEHINTCPNSPCVSPTIDLKLAVELSVYMSVQVRPSSGMLARKPVDQECDECPDTPAPGFTPRSPHSG